MAETISFERVPYDKSWKKQSFLILGPPKIGKSELFASGHGSLFLDIEGGLNHLEVMKHPKDRPFLDWDELENCLDTLVAMRHKGTFPKHVDTIVIDTATRLVSLATAKALELLNKKFNKDWETIEEINIGGDKGNPGWSMRTNMIDNLMAKCKQLEIAIVIIGHLEHKKVKTDINGTPVEFDKATISLGGNIGKAFLAFPDHILNIVSKNDGGIISRIVRALDTPTIQAGSRGLCVPDRWELVNPTARTPEALKIAAKANYDKLRSFFAE